MNPYDKGVVSNIKEALFAKLPPSKVDFQAVAMPSRLCPPAYISSKKQQLIKEAGPIKFKS